MATMQKSSFQIQLQGFAAANRDATVRLQNVATGQVLERKPFLDGSLVMHGLEPGQWEVQVNHPNLTLPIDRRIVRLFPQHTPTRVNIPVPESLFRDTPIRDIVDADLGPVQQTAAAVRAGLQPISQKAPGEVIRAADWVQLVQAVSDLAGAVGELCQLVSPRGHDHPEIAEKIDEVQGNLRRFAEAYGQSLLQLRREIEARKLGTQVADVLDRAGLAANDDLRRRIEQPLEDLRGSLQTDTVLFTRKLANTGQVLRATVAEMAQQQEAPEQFLQDEAVQQLLAVADQYADSGVQARPESEIQLYDRAASRTAGQSLGLALGGVGRNRIIG